MSSFNPARPHWLAEEGGRRVGPMDGAWRHPYGPGAYALPDARREAPPPERLPPEPEFMTLA